MRPYKLLTIISSIITLITLTVCLLLHYFCICSESDFWVNVCLAIFGSALLTVLTSLISYFHEKKSTLEGFMYHCRHLLHFLNKYQSSMSLEEKMKFFLDYHDIDKSAWDSAYGNMDFFFEARSGNRKYIYQNIYLPILRFNRAVASHVWHFRWYFDGTGKNTPVMEGFVDQLERHLLYSNEQDVPTEYDKNGTPISFCKTTYTEEKLVSEITHELNGKYFIIMYGKTKAQRAQKGSQTSSPNCNR